MKDAGRLIALWVVAPLAVIAAVALDLFDGLREWRRAK